MDKSAWINKVIHHKNLNKYSRLVALILSHTSDKNGKNCFYSQSVMAEMANLSENLVRAALRDLIEEGFVERELATKRADIPKSRGYVWSLVPVPSGGEPSQREPSSAEPSQAEGSADASGDAPSQTNKNNNLNNTRRVNPHAVRVSTVVPTTKTTKEGDRGRSSATSRAREQAREELTYSAPPSPDLEPSSAEERPIDRAEVAAIKQAIEDALPTLDLSGVRGLYGLAQQILAGRGGLDEAKLYVERRGLEWTQRLLEGQRYPAYAVVRLIAKDAPSWRPPSASRAPLQAPAAPPQAAPLAQLPDWWSSLLNSLYEALKGHRRHDSAQSRTYAKQLAGLLHHLSRPLQVCYQAGELTILIDDTGPDPDTFELATSYIPYLLQKSERIELTATRIERSSTALRRAS
jgi:anti-sigma28 factor (negative regulator of flagellin synthesis)